jgi:hypothetical protein
MEYRVKILYGYGWKGEGKTGDRYGLRGNPNYNKRDKVESIVESYPVGKETKVFVNPADPDFAILQPDSKAAGYSLWVPLLFVVGGLGISVRAAMKGLSRPASP